jgi:hypothetical protein
MRVVAKAIRAILRAIMIHPYSNETQTRWDRGDFKVQLNQPNNTRPIGFCDGSDADLLELQAMAESEGADEMRIERKPLKSGRELWTLHGGAGRDEFE